jgi:hypothetical protein
MAGGDFEAMEAIVHTISSSSSRFCASRFHACWWNNPSSIEPEFAYCSCTAGGFISGDFRDSHIPARYAGFSTWVSLRVKIPHILIEESVYGPGSCGFHSVLSAQFQNADVLEQYQGDAHTSIASSIQSTPT